MENLPIVTWRLESDGNWEKRTRKSRLALRKRDPDSLMTNCNYLNQRQGVNQTKRKAHKESCN